MKDVLEFIGVSLIVIGVALVLLGEAVFRGWCNSPLEKLDRWWKSRSKKL